MQFIEMLVAFLLSFDAGTRTGKLHKLVANRAAFDYCARIGAIDEVTAQAFASIPATNKVQGYRIAELVNFIATGDIRYFNAPLALAFCFATLNETGASASFGDMRFALSGAGDSDSKHVPGLPGSRVRKAFGSVKASTAQTQLSKFVGKRGILTMLGILEPTDGHGAKVGNKNHPLALAYARRIASIPEGDLLKKLNLEALHD